MSDTEMKKMYLFARSLSMLKRNLLVVGHFGFETLFLTNMAPF